MKKLFKNSFLALLSLLVFLSLLLVLPVWIELSVRLFRPIYYKYISKNSDSYYELPGTYDIQQHYLLPHTYRPKYLYNGRKYVRQKPNGIKRIYCVGGSTTYGHMVGDKNFARILESKLIAAEQSFEVINAGVMGYGSTESVVDFMTNGVDLSPDFAFWYHGVNDGKDQEFADRREFERTGSHWSHHFYVTTFLRRSGVLDRIQSLLLPSSGNKEPVPGNIFNFGADATDRKIASERYLQLYRVQVESFIVISKANGVVPLLGKIASMYGSSKEERSKIRVVSLPEILPEEESWIHKIRKLNLVLDELSKKYNVPLVPTDLISGNGDLFYDQTHQSPEGHERQAGEIFKVILSYKQKN